VGASVRHRTTTLVGVPCWRYGPRTMFWANREAAASGRQASTRTVNAEREAGRDWISESVGPNRRMRS
jgi:hypothetical protein